MFLDSLKDALWFSLALTLTIVMAALFIFAIGMAGYRSAWFLLLLLAEPPLMVATKLAWDEV